MLSLSACANVPKVEKEEVISTLGFTGIDLAGVNRDYDMDASDQYLMYSCVGLDAYNTHVLQSPNGTSESIDEETGKDQLRTETLRYLKLVENSYPEVSIYADGVAWELLSPGKNTEGFVMFQQLCKTYNQVFKRVQANYAEPITIRGACWSQDGMYGSLQEKMVTLGYFFRTKKKPSRCRLAPKPDTNTASNLLFQGSNQISFEPCV